MNILEALARAFGLSLGWAVALSGCSGATDDDDGKHAASFETVTMVSIPGHVPYPAGTCDPTSYLSTRAVVAATRELSWDYCGPTPGVFTFDPQVGSRTLDDAQFRAVEAAVRELHGSDDDTSCAVDAGSVLVDVKSATGVALYADELLSGCPRPEHEGRTFADIEALSIALDPT